MCVTKDKLMVKLSFPVAQANIGGGGDRGVHPYLSCRVCSQLKEAPGDGVGGGVVTSPEELASVGCKLLWVHRGSVLVVDQSA